MHLYMRITSLLFCFKSECHIISDIMFTATQLLGSCLFIYLIVRLFLRLFVHFLFIHLFFPTCEVGRGSSVGSASTWYMRTILGILNFSATYLQNNLS